MVEARTLISTPQQRVAHEIGHDLRHDAEADALEPVGADRAQALVGLHVDVLDHLVEQLAERADRVEADRDDGRRSGRSRGSASEEAGDDDLREGAQQFHEAAHDEAQPADAASGCARRGSRTARPKTKPMKVETSAMLSVIEHQVEIFGNVEAAPDIDAAVGIVVFLAAVVVGRRQVEQRPPDVVPVVAG